jgi:hypothetical protein
VPETIVTPEDWENLNAHDMSSWNCSHAAYALESAAEIIAAELKCSFSTAIAMIVLTVEQRQD